ncbi:universal stress protein [Microvirga sp. CF3016]|uniref:universal stress protein n=1 Tax=Microvirga sp. CF3016 TaxID=3110181 RepID=UPI002E788B41|nr:universal stress protein [Microvirga sp. CF3016]MEE1611364.1 universal stress protein [Microvirga sp. CF3016]
MIGLPKTILLATDLSARCDRATDRAVALAEEWQAMLVVLHVLENLDTGGLHDFGPVPSWRRPPDPVAVALDFHLGFRVERRGRLVQNDDRSIFSGRPARYPSQGSRPPGKDRRP